ncbi:TrbG/VirB9 family P-type conjugative transfer protein [Thalassospira sp. NFXS8]|uniref:TrbG/VirB9 family P-type conjugative transfer protein n=1 Tax=Thalassospira sp. NFXS8 TaxID=2819093 RepID=UPI0032DEC483
MKNHLRKFAWTLALATLLVSLAAVFVIHTARAQTPAFTSSRPPMPGQRQNANTQTNTANTANSNGQQADATASASPAPKVPTMPVPDSVVKQAKDQAEGRFGPMVRPRTSGQIQDAWDYAEKSDGVYVTDVCETCTYRVRTREYLVTLIELPAGEEINRIDVGDPRSWSVNKRDERRIAIRPASYGYDTSMIVYGGSGHVYPFYLRAEGVNSINMPDLLVRLKGSVTTKDDMTVAMIRPQQRMRYGSGIQRTALQNEAGIILPDPVTGQYHDIQEIPLDAEGNPIQLTGPDGTPLKGAYQARVTGYYQGRPIIENVPTGTHGTTRPDLVAGRFDSEGNLIAPLSYDGSMPVYTDENGQIMAGQAAPGNETADETTGRAGNDKTGSNITISRTRNGIVTSADRTGSNQSGKSGTTSETPGGAASGATAKSETANANNKELAAAVHDLGDTDPGTPKDDFIADAGFDPNKLRGWGDYDLWGDDELRPVTVFRDDYFTYIRFGDRWKDLELPTAYVVVDGVDELVNTRIQGHTYIIESTQRLISLKSGKKFLCIEYEGD